MTAPRPKRDQADAPVAQGWRELLRDPLLGILLVLALSSVFGALFLVGAEGYGTDFYRYWVGARAVRLGWTDNIYSNQGRDTIEQKALAEATNPAMRLTRAVREVHHVDAGRVEMIGTPFVFTVFGAGYTGDYDRDFQFYRLFCLAVYALAFVALCRVVRLPLAASLALLAFFAFFFGPFQSDAKLGNVSRLQLGALVLFIWLQSKCRWRLRDAVSGAALGLAVMFKPTLGVALAAVFALWLMNRRYRKVLEAAVGAALGVFFAVAAAAAFFGSFRCWSQWVDVLPQILNSQRTSADGNLGLSRIILETFSVDASWVLMAALLGGVLLVGWRSRRRAVEEPSGAAAEEKNLAPLDRRELHETFLGVGLGVAVMWLSMRLAWAHYLLLLVPLTIYCLAAAGAESGPAARAARLCRAAALVFLITLGPVGAAISGGAHADPRLASVAVLALYGAAVARLWWPPGSTK